MLKLIQKIHDKVFEFAPADKGVIYISHKIGEKTFKLINIEGQNIKVDDPKEYIYNPQILGDSVIVGDSEGNGFRYNQDFKQRIKIDFRIKKTSAIYSLVMQRIKGVKIMGCLCNRTQRIIWKLNYFSTMTFFGWNTFYAVKNVIKQNNHIYAYDLKTGKEKWLYVIDTNENYGSVKFYTEYDGQIFVAYRTKLHAHDIETGELRSSTPAYYGQIYNEDGVPHILSFFSKFSLKTLEAKMFDFKPLLVPYWGKYQQTTYIDCIVEGCILIGTHEFLTDADLPEEGVFNLLLIDPNKNKVVWNHQFPHLGMANYKEAKYENNKLYFLDQNGTLTIFEKEN